jgi:glycosyltransferase involved in cell wall biosynthesis
MKTPAKFLIILPSGDFGGLASLASSLAAGIGAQGYEVCQIFLYSKNVGRKSSSREISLDRPPQKGVIGKFLNLGIRMHRLKEHLKAERPEFVICLDPVSLFLVMISGYRKKIHLAAACFTPAALLNYRDKFLIKYIYHYANFVVCPSTSMRNELQNLNTRLRPEIIPNPLPSEGTICKLNQFPPKNQTQTQIHFLGRLSPEKGVKKFLELAKARPKIHFIVSGDGPDSSLVKDFNLPNVSFNGWVNSSACLSQANLLIVPSTSESFGIVVVEAWMHGVPVLTSEKAQGAAELVYKHGLGAVVSDYDDLQEWLENLDRLKQMKLTNEDLTEVLNTFGEDSIANLWSERFLICLPH